MKAIYVLICASLVFPLYAKEATSEPEYYCHSLKTDMYAPAYEGDKQECESSEDSEFVVNPRGKFGWSCRYTDAIFFLGKKVKKKQAKEACQSGQLKKL
jgi:hypothetical protein